MSILTFESFQRARYSAQKSKGKRTKAEEQEYAKDSSFNFVFKTEGFLFDPSYHASAQAKDRRPEFKKDDWKKLHRNVKFAMKKAKVKEGYHLFYSKSLEQGYVSYVKRGRTIKIITVLPKYKHNPKGGDQQEETKLILTESLNMILTNMNLNENVSINEDSVHIIE